MKMKLTLLVDSKSVAYAKQLADREDTSVSQLFESYIQRLEQIHKKLKKVKDPWVERFSGIYDPSISAVKSDHRKQK